MRAPAARMGPLMHATTNHAPGAAPVHLAYPPIEAPKDPGTALVLELLPGIVCQTWGIGNIYAGRVGVGLAIMLGYWFLQAINFVLMFVLVGFVTGFLTFVATAVLSSLLAWNAARASQDRWRAAVAAARAG